MDTTLVNLAPALQLIGLAVCVVMAIVIGVRVLATGARGFAQAIPEVVGLLVGLWVVARPNDLLGLLLKAVGGVQAPTALH